MTQLLRLLKLEAIGLLALLLTAAALGAYGAVESASYGDAMIGPWDSAKLMFGYTAMIGVLPVVIYGVPAYFALSYRQTPRWYWVLLVGVVLGLGFAAFDTSMVRWAVGCGASVALLTHLGASRLVPNVSLSPTLQRGLG